MFKCFYFCHLFLFPGTVFGNGKTSDYLLLGNTVYTVSLPLSSQLPQQLSLLALFNS